jgi:hypothetical protein
MKICFFVKVDSKTTQELGQFFKSKGYIVIQSQTPDEIDQAGNQASRLVLLFDQPKFAYEYLTNYKWPAFKTLNILYTEKKPRISPQQNLMLEQVSLTIFSKGENMRLTKTLNEFENSSSAENETIELKFTILEELKKK